MFRPIRARFRSLLKSHATKSASKRKESHLQNRRRPYLESLETRALLAGDDYSVIDTNPYGGGSLFNKSAVYGTDLYYVDTDPTYGAELRRLDTTTGQVSLVADINPGIGDSFPGYPGVFSLFGDKLFFAAYDPEYGYEVRWIDVTQSTPTIHTVDIWTGAYSSIPGAGDASIAVGSKLYFTTYDQQLTTIMLCWIDMSLDDPQPHFADRLPGGIYAYRLPSGSNFTSAADKIYFVGETPGLGYELQWIDTQAAPSKVNTLDLTLGSESTFAWNSYELGGITAVADKVFIRKDGVNPFTIWIDASLPTPVVHNNSLLGSVAASGDRVYSFLPTTGSQGGVFAWADATADDLDFEYTAVSSTITLNQVAVQYVADSKMYLNVGTNDDSDFYWIDLASASPSLKKISFNETNGRGYESGAYGPRAGAISGTSIRHFAYLNHKLYFPANDDYGVEMRWIDTLSTSPTVHTLDISLHNELQGNVRSSYPGQYGGLVSVGDKLFFVADDSENVVGIDPAIQQSYLAIGKSKLRWIDTTSDDPDLHTIALGSSGYGGPWGFTVVGSRMIFKSAGYGVAAASTQWIDVDQANPTVHTIARGEQYRAQAGWPDQPNHMFGVNGNQVYFDTDGFLYRTDLSDASPGAQRVTGPGTLFPGIYGGYASVGSKMFFFGSDSTMQDQKLRWLDVSQTAPTIHTIDVKGAFIGAYNKADNFFFVSGTRLYFQGQDSNGRSVKWIDASEDDPIVHSLAVSGARLEDRVIQVDDKIYFFGTTTFWISATAANPQVQLVSGLTSAAGAYVPKAVGNKIYFDSVNLSWIDTVASPSTYKSLSGPYIIIEQRTDTGLRQMAVVGTKLFFDADKSALKWIDTSEAQPTLHSIATLDYGISYPWTRIVTAIDDTVYFIAADLVHGPELRWLNGLDPNLTVHTVDIASGPVGFVSELGLQNIAITDTTFYFTAWKNGLDRELIALIPPTNNAPSDLNISETTFAEILYPNNEVASFTTDDLDADTFTYSLVSGDNDDDNNQFLILGDKLIQKRAFDFETKSSYTIRVRTTDASFASFEKSFLITILDVAEAPTAAEDTYDIPVNYLREFKDAWGNLTVALTDDGVLANDSDDEGDPFTAELVTPPLHGILTFNNDGTFRYKPASDAAVGQSETFTYRVTDSTGLSSEATVTLNIGARIDSPFYNPTTHTDVLPGTSPGTTSSLDALAIINFLNAHRGRISIPVEELPQVIPPAFYYDVNNDFVISSLDILAIYNYLNIHSRGAEGESVTSVITNSDRRNLENLFDAAIVDLSDLEKLKGRYS